MVVAIVAIVVYAGTDWIAAADLPALVIVAPTFDPLTILSLGLPLFIVTMAGQNVPGFTVLSTNGYPPPPRFALVSTGLGSAGAAFFNFLIPLPSLNPKVYMDPRRSSIPTPSNGRMPIGKIRH